MSHFYWHVIFEWIFLSWTLIGRWFWWESHSDDSLGIGWSYFLLERCVVYYILFNVLCRAKNIYYNLGLSCTLYFIKLHIIKVHYKRDFIRIFFMDTLEVPSSFLGKWINRVLGLSFGHLIIDIYTTFLLSICAPFGSTNHHLIVRNEVS